MASSSQNRAACLASHYFCYFLASAERELRTLSKLNYAVILFLTVHIKQLSTKTDFNQLLQIGKGLTSQNLLEYAQFLNDSADNMTNFESAIPGIEVSSENIVIYIRHGVNNIENTFKFSCMPLPRLLFCAVH